MVINEMYVVCDVFVVVVEWMGIIDIVDSEILQVVLEEVI